MSLTGQVNFKTIINSNILNKLKSKEKLKSEKKNGENSSNSDVSNLDNKSDQSSSATTTTTTTVSSLTNRISFTKKLKSFSSKDGLSVKKSPSTESSSTQKKKDSKKDKKSKKNESNGPFICLWMKDDKACNIEFENAELLYKHLCDDHVGRKANNNLCLTCHWNNCNFTKNKRDHITSHLRKHISFKPFVCQICERAFKRPQDLKKHKIVHEEDRSKLQDLKSSTQNKYGIKVENGFNENNENEKINILQYRKIGKNEISPKQTIGKRPPEYENYVNSCKRQAGNESVLKQINYNNQLAMNIQNSGLMNSNSIKNINTISTTNTNTISTTNTNNVISTNNSSNNNNNNNGNNNNNFSLEQTKGNMQNYISDLNDMYNKQSQTTATTTTSLYSVPSNSKPLLRMNSNPSFAFSGKTETSNHVFGVPSKINVPVTMQNLSLSNVQTSLMNNNNNNPNNNNNINNNNNNNNNSSIYNSNSSLSQNSNSQIISNTIPITNSNTLTSFSSINNDYLNNNNINTTQSLENPNIKNMMNLPPLTSQSDTFNNMALLNNSNSNDVLNVNLDDSLLNYEYANLNEIMLPNSINELKSIIQSNSNPLKIVEAFFDGIIKNEIQPLYNSDMQIYLDCLITILQDQNLIKQLNIFQNSEDFNKVINFLSTLSQHTEQTQIHDFGLQSLNLIGNSKTTTDEYDFDYDDPELMNIGVDDYLVDIPQNNLLLNQQLAPPINQQKSNIIPQPVFNPCEEIIDDIIDDNALNENGGINRYETVVNLNKPSIDNNLMSGMLSPQGYVSSEDGQIMSKSPLFIDSSKPSLPLTPPPQQVPYRTNVVTTNTLADTMTYNNFSGLPSFNTINPVKMETMDSFNEFDKLQRGRYRIVRDANDEQPTVQLVLNNANENYTTEDLLNNYTSYTLNATQSKNIGKTSNNNNNNNNNNNTSKTTTTKPVIIKQEPRSNNSNNYNNNRSNYFNSDIGYSGNNSRKNRPSTSPTDNKIKEVIYIKTIIHQILLKFIILLITKEMNLIWNKCKINSKKCLFLINL